MSKIMPKKRVRTQNSIMKAALILFSKNGFDETSMESIAEKAEISAGTLYNYYGSKPVLLLAIFADRTKEIRKNPPQISTTKMNQTIAINDINMILKLAVQSIIIFPKKVMRQVFAQLQVLEGTEVDELIALDMEIVALLVPILERMKKNRLLADIDLENAALLLFGSLMTQFQLFISLETVSKDQLEEAIAIQVEMILFGLFDRK